MEGALSVCYRLASKARLTFDTTRGKHMLLYPERGLELNEVAGAILTLCDGRTPVRRIVEVLTSRFKEGEPGSIAQDVTTFLAKLEQRGLVHGD